MGHADAARVKQVALAVHQFLHVGIFGGGGSQLFVKGDRLHLIALRFQTAAAGHKLIKLALDDGQLRGQLLCIQTQQSVTGGDTVALIHKDFGHHTTGFMLDDLPVAVDFDPARSHHRPGDLAGHGPSPKTAEKQDQPEEPKDQGPGCRPAFVSVIGHTTPPDRGGAC